MTTPDTTPQWGTSYRLTASDKWKAKSAAMGRDVTEALVDYAQPIVGMHILDVASGTGEPAITLAGRVGPTGHVTASDLSSELLEVAAERARQRGFHHMTVQQADAQALPFSENRFDLATSRFGVMFFPDIHRALSELRRVLKSGARVAFACWGSQDQPYFSTTMGIVHRNIGGPFLVPGGPDPFRFAPSGSLSEALRTAGFEDVHEENRALRWIWPGPPEEAWEQLQAIATPFLPLLKRVPPAMWPTINTEVHAAIRQYETSDGIAFGANVVFASGKKP